jgi:vitamin B12 transporter
MNLLLAFTFTALSLFRTEEDTVTVVRMDPVVVTGTRTALSLFQQPAPVHVVDSAAFASLNGTTVADKLRMLSGVTVQPYGSHGSLRTVSVRGMGADYSLVLLDGVRYTTFQIGTVDLGIFSGHDIARIEVANGGNSALYGADAVGGVINIITHRAGGTPFLRASVHGGSYGASGYTLSGSTGFDGWSLRASAERRRATNDYEFLYNDGGSEHRLRRIGADFTSTSGSFTTVRTFSSSAVSTLSLRYSDVERGQPSAVTSAVQSAAARLHDKDMVIHSATTLALSDGDELSIPLTFRSYRQTYADPSLITRGEPLNAYYENTSFTFAPVHRHTFDPNHTIVAGGELIIAAISSNELFASRREQYSLFVSGTHQWPGGVDVALFPSVRYDAFSDTEGGLSAKAGVNLGLLDLPSVHLRASVGRNYRVPTFNDLYWIDGGNPLLTPEHSLNTDAGFIAGYETDDISAEADAGYFRIDATNKIVWRPGQNGRWSPVNVQSVRSTGLEFRSTLDLFRGLLRWQYHHTFMRTVKTSADGPNDATVNKIVPYVPQETITTSLGTHIGDVSANILYAVTGYRFMSADNDPRSILPTVRTVDMNISYRFTLPLGILHARSEINNLFNEAHQMITGYPLPLRTFTLSMEFTYSPQP